MERWISLLIFFSVARSLCQAITFNQTCNYDPCHNGATCMNVLRPPDGVPYEMDGRYYLYVRMMMTWEKALDYCTEMKGSLVSYEHKEEEEVDADFSDQFYPELFWTSARYHASNDSWKWSPSNNTYYDIGEVVTSVRGQCLAYKKTTNFQVEGVPCNTEHYFMCEFDEEPSPTWTSLCRCPPSYSGFLCEKYTPTADDPLITCEGDRFDLTCALESKFIRIDYAAYGRFDNFTCDPDPSEIADSPITELNCLAQSSLINIASRCNGETFCEAEAINNQVFQARPCRSKKYLEVRYRCVESNDRTIFHGPYPEALLASPVPYCPVVVYGNVTWEKTMENVTLTKYCPDGFLGNITFACLADGEWASSGPDNSQCRERTLGDDISDKIANGDVPATDIVLEINNALGSGNQASTLSAGEGIDLLDKANDLLITQLASNQSQEQRVSTVAKYAEEAIGLATRVISLDTNDTESEESVTSRVTEVVEDIAFLYAGQLEVGRARSVSSSSIVLTCSSVPRKLRSLGYPEDPIFNDVDRSEINAILPASTFDNDSNTKINVALITYKELNLGNRTILSSNVSDEALVNKSVVNSVVFGASVTIGNMTLHNFSMGDELVFIMIHRMPNLQGVTTCAFWDSTDTTETSSGSWSTAGCRVVESTRNQTTCACRHLTNFAILLDVTGVHQELDPANELALTAITYIGCSISIVCLGLCIFAFSFFRSLWNTRTTIHRNLCISLFVAEILFLVGVEQTRNELVCAIIAAVLHYSFLCAFAWMCLEGIQLYIMLVHVFSTTSKVFPYYLAGYGIPAVIVGISGGVSKGAGYGTKKYCWLSDENGFIWSFAGPVAFVILVNVIFLVVSIRVAYAGRSAVSKDATSSQNIKVWIKGAVTLTFLLGSTWAIGFLFLSGSLLPLAYAFTILNSLQGLFIFIYHCLGNERIKKEIAKLLLRQKCLPRCLREKLESIAMTGTSTYSTQQSHVQNTDTKSKTKKSDTVALSEKKDTVHPVVYVQDIDVDDKPRSWLYSKSIAADTKVQPAMDYPDPDYH